MPVTNVMKWYKGDDMPLTDIFRLSESMTDRFVSMGKE